MAKSLILLLLALLPATLHAQPKKRPPGPAPVLARELLITQSDTALDWRWRTPPEAGLEPNLLRAMRGEALTEATKARQRARKDRTQAETAGFPFRKHDYWTDWTVAANTKRLLVLQGTSWQFTGGAHGNTGYAARLWDKQTGHTIPLEALFTDWPRARRLLEPAYCAALEQQRREKRGTTRLMDDFETCPPLAEQFILPASAPADRTASSVRILLAPYVAGPFAEGTYEINLPWPPGTAALVAPPWRGALGLD